MDKYEQALNIRTDRNVFIMLDRVGKGWALCRFYTAVYIFQSDHYHEGWEIQNFTAVTATGIEKFPNKNSHCSDHCPRGNFPLYKEFSSQWDKRSIKTTKCNNVC